MDLEGREAGQGFEGRGVVDQKSLFIELSENEQQIIKLLEDVEDLSIDKLSKKIQLNSSKMAELMLDLEFKGIVKTLPGKRYVLT